MMSPTRLARSMILSGLLLAVRLVAGTGALCPTPPMGWNSFQSYGVYLHEKAAFENLEALATKLAPHGYEYFVIDGGWYGEYRLRPGTLYATQRHAEDVRLDAFGRVQPSNCYFPNGLKALIDRCHELGLKFGLHMMRGIPRKAVEQNLPVLGTDIRAADIADTTPERLCQWCTYNYGVDMSKPGAQAYYDSLFAMFAAWGVDFVKYDDIVEFPAEIQAVVKARDKCGRAIVLSLSPGDDCDPANLATFQQAQMLRVTHDIWDNAKGINSCFSAWRKWSGAEHPGFWIDMDMIPFGELQLMNPPQDSSGASASGTEIRLAGEGTHRKCRLTPAEMRTFITLRALSASPLMMGGALTSLDEFSLSLLTNPEMLACNQNGVMGRLTRDQDSVEIWSTTRRNQPGQGWAGVFNRRDDEVERPVAPADLGLDRGAVVRVLDVWNNRWTTMTDATPLQSRIPPHGVMFLRYETVAGRN